MSVADRGEKEKTMPVQELPMPPVKVQRQDTSGGAAFSQPRADQTRPVPQLILNFS